jgi:putative phosphoesterase
VTTTVVVVSDTHVPQKARAVPDELWAAVEAADVVVHAGDWTGTAILDEFERRSRRLVGVWGNNDGDELRARLPEVARETIDGVRVAVVHETGQKEAREARADRLHPETDLLLFGHSHIPWDSTTASGTRLLNPGSPTDKRRQPRATYLSLVLDAGTVRDVVLHELPLRPTTRSRRADLPPGPVREIDVIVPHPRRRD